MLSEKKKDFCISILKNSCLKRIDGVILPFNSQEVTNTFIQESYGVSILPQQYRAAHLCYYYYMSPDEGFQKDIRAGQMTQLVMNKRQV